MSVIDLMEMHRSLNLKDWLEYRSYEQAQAQVQVQVQAQAQAQTRTRQGGGR